MKRLGLQGVSRVLLLSWITCSPSLRSAECGDPVKFKAAAVARRLETITALQSRFAPRRAEQKGPSALRSISVSQQPLSRPRSVTRTLPQHHCSTGHFREREKTWNMGLCTQQHRPSTNSSSQLWSTITKVCLELIFRVA